MSASNHKVGSPINVWQSLANKFINQSSQLKVYWDKVGEIVREKHDALCDYIDSYIATKQELQQVTIGLIPDGTVTQDKLAPSLKESLPAQYVRNRIPTSGDNFASGHKIGDAWYIPDITLNNLVPTPLAINTADFTIQNANASASGSAVTLSCLGGFDFASFKRTITPVAGALYVLFADLKLTSTHVLTSLSLNDQVIASPVQDTVYHVACVVTAPTEIEIKAQALDGTALNGATVVIDKLTIVNMTADMDGVPFDKAGAEAYFQVNSAFNIHVLGGSGTKYYCSDNGAWQQPVRVIDEISGFLMLKASISADMLDYTFGKNNENYIRGVGNALALYAWSTGLTDSDYQFMFLRNKSKLADALYDEKAMIDLLSCQECVDKIDQSPWAKDRLTTAINSLTETQKKNAICTLSGLEPSNYSDLTALLSNSTAMGMVASSKKATTFIANSGVMTNVLAQSVAGTAITTSVTAMGSLAYSYRGMKAVNADKPFLNLCYDSLVATTAIEDSPTARVALSESPLVITTTGASANLSSAYNPNGTGYSLVPAKCLVLQVGGMTNASNGGACYHATLNHSRGKISGALGGGSSWAYLNVCKFFQTLTASQSYTSSSSYNMTFKATHIPLT